MVFKQPLLAASVYALAASAHLFISSPSPIPGSAIKDPLKDDGSNFPCHGIPLPGSGGQKMAVGSKQLLAFDLGEGQNTAEHGGGSCQLSLTYETDPQKVRQPSAWKVIYSIEGGCPTNSIGNLNGYFLGPEGNYSIAIPCDSSQSNNFDCVNSFDFTIPEGVKNGQATLAWTWYNTVGNREIYMNCAAVDITGGSDNATMEDFPDMWTANMGAFSDYRSTSEQVNVKFPDPGKYVTTKTAFTSTYTSKGAVYTISTAKAFPLAIPSVYSNGNSVWTSALGSSGAVPTSYAAGPGSYTAGSAASSPVTAPTSYAAAPSPYAAVPTLATSAGAAPMPSGTGYAGASNSTSGSCSGGKVSCPTPGQVICVDENTFGLCDIDYCAVPQAVAAGTTCSNNVVSKRDVVKRRNSRLHRHIPYHIAHKHSS
ncbi:hypothetical protein QM012_005220 [Aureobasidium pullulans]|uniref:Lytic polysaccharide monooxygenase n=1 Tax=Aureobasidium pullulans TaxID=5580 RepID=A0ABR0T6F9_AURPU